MEGPGENTPTGAPSILEPDDINAGIGKFADAHQPASDVPWNAIFLFDGAQRSWSWSDADLAAFAAKVARHFIRFVRNCPDWFDSRTKPPVPRPFLKSKSDPDKFDLNLPNPKYDAALLRYKRALNRAGVEVWYDLFDNCGQGKPWSPWVKNVNGIHGIYEYNEKALGYYRAWIKRIFGILGKRSLYGLGNELYFPGWANKPEADAWGEKWALGLANYLRGLGARYPLTFSANMEEHGTQSRIIGWLTENGWSGGKGERLIHVVHNMGLAEHWDAVWATKKISAAAGIGVDEDGVGMNEFIIPTKPVNKRGLCEEPGVRCGVKRRYWVEMVRQAQRTVGPRLRIVCRMPKELAMSYQPVTALREWQTLGVFDDLRAPAPAQDPAPAPSVSENVTTPKPGS